MSRNTKIIGSMFAGGATIAGGAAGEVGGVALDATGVGAIAGVPLNIASAGAIAYGGTVIVKSGGNLYNDFKDLVSFAKTNGAASSGGTSNAGNVTKGGSKGEVLKQNKVNGDAYEKSLSNELNKKQNDVASQITIKTDSGVKTRVDFVGKDKATGNIKLTEAKSSSTAPLTPNQKTAYPEIAKSGGTVVGKGKEPYTGDTKIPPTKVDVIRKK